MTAPVHPPPHEESTSYTDRQGHVRTLIPPPPVPPSPPSNGDAPSGPGAHGPGRLAQRRDEAALASSRWVRLGGWALLLVLAGADAFGFWQTLNRLIQRDSLLVGFFVSALALGSVAGAHLVGAWARSRREGYGGSLVWICTVSLLWLSLGGLIGWIRATNSEPSSDATGDLADAAEAVDAAGDGLTQTSIQMAALLLGLYLLTGAIAMTFAYKHGDPRSAHIHRLLRERRRLAEEQARLAHEMRIAEGRRAVREQDREYDAEQFDLEQGRQDVRTDSLRADANLHNAGYQGDPQATDALTVQDAGADDNSEEGAR